LFIPILLERFRVGATLRAQQAPYISRKTAGNLYIDRECSENSSSRDILQHRRNNKEGETKLGSHVARAYASTPFYRVPGTPGKSDSQCGRWVRDGALTVVEASQDFFPYK